MEYEAKCTAANQALFDLWSDFNGFLSTGRASASSGCPCRPHCAVMVAVPTSAIATERSFAILRNIALPLRCAMTLASVKRELRMRVHS